MFVRHPHLDGNLGAGLVDRNYICSTVPPGSQMWNNWSCGPVPGTQAARPSPAPSPMPAPDRTPSPAQIAVDPDAARRIQAAEEARIAAEIAAAAHASEQASAARPTPLDEQVINPGAFGASTFAVNQPKTSAPITAVAPASGGAPWPLLLLALAGVALVARHKRAHRA